MAWKDVEPMEERVRFVLAASGQEMSLCALCRRFGVSRKTGYKWLRRYEEGGLAAMEERSRRPLKSPKRIARWVEEAVLQERRAHRNWGPKKVRSILARKRGPEFAPAASTIGNILKRHGLTARRRPRRAVSGPDRSGRTEPTRPNEANHHRAILALSTAFWDAWLRDDAAAKT